MTSASLWLAHADHDPNYALWLERVDRLCVQLLDIDFEHLMHEGDFDAGDAYHKHGIRPEKFVAEFIIPYLQSEHGSELVFDSIGENVIWGSCLSHALEGE